MFARHMFAASGVSIIRSILKAPSGFWGGAACSMFCCMIGFVLGSGPKVGPPDRIVAKSFAIVDENDKVRGEWKVSGNRVSFELQDEKQEPRVRLEVGDLSRIVISGEHGVALSVGNSDKDGLKAAMFDQDKNVRMLFAVNRNNVLFSMLDFDAVTRYQQVINSEHTASLRLFGATREPVWEQSAKREIDHGERMLDDPAAPKGK